MLRRITLAVFAIAASRNVRRRRRPAGAEPAGRGFCGPACVPDALSPPIGAYAYTTVYAPPVDIRPLVAGYYGKPNSYFYSPYYGESQYWNFSRLPYACGFYGYC